MKSRYALLLLLLLFISKSYAQDSFITIGSGGGFTGAATVYKITSTGKVYKGTGTGEIKYTECAKLKKSNAKKYLAVVQAQTKSNPEFNHPGNMYYFISNQQDKTTTKLTWGDQNHPVPDEVKKLYTDIHQSVSALRYKPIK